MVFFKSAVPKRSISGWKRLHGKASVTPYSISHFLTPAKIFSPFFAYCYIRDLAKVGLSQSMNSEPILLELTFWEVLRHPLPLCMCQIWHVCTMQKCMQKYMQKCSYLMYIVNHHARMIEINHTNSKNYTSYSFRAKFIQVYYHVIHGQEVHV